MTLTLLDVLAIVLIAGLLDVLGWRWFRGLLKQSYVTKVTHEELHQLMIHMQLTNVALNERVGNLLSKIEDEGLERSTVNRAIAERLNVIAVHLGLPEAKLVERK